MNEVKVTGEALHPILWCGRQWAVTEFGVEARNGTYAIGKDRLGEMDWQEHMFDKNWVDRVDFLLAYTIGLNIHSGEYDQLTANPKDRFLDWDDIDDIDD